MTRTYTAKPVWTWRCDDCGHEERIAREQSLLASPDEMRAVGWHIAKLYGDKCAECVMRGGRSARDIALRFLSKPMTTRKGIIADLGLRQDDDGRLPPDREWNALMLARVTNAGKISELAAHPAMFGAPTQPSEPEVDRA